MLLKCVISRWLPTIPYITFISFWLNCTPFANWSNPALISYWFFFHLSMISIIFFVSGFLICSSVALTSSWTIFISYSIRSSCLVFIAAISFLKNSMATIQLLLLLWLHVSGSRMHPLLNFVWSELHCWQQLLFNSGSWDRLSKKNIPLKLYTKQHILGIHRDKQKLTSEWNKCTYKQLQSDSIER